MAIIEVENMVLTYILVHVLFRGPCLAVCAQAACIFNATAAIKPSAAPPPTWRNK